MRDKTLAWAVLFTDRVVCRKCSVANGHHPRLHFILVGARCAQCRARLGDNSRWSWPALEAMKEAIES